MSDSDTVLNHLKLVVRKEDFVEYDIKTPGKTGKGDGYLGRVTFATVTGKKNNGETKILELILKTPSPNKTVRQKVPIRELFLKEIYIYDKVIPAFEDLLNETGANNRLLQFIPVCHLTGSTEGQEFIILENLKTRGFDLWDRLKPMPYNCIKKVLETCGRWHAFSFAMRHKKPETFKKLVEENNLNMWSEFISRVGIKDIVFRYFDEVRSAYKDDEEIASKLKFTKKDAEFIFRDLLYEESSHHVIIHGDSWTNNLMFKLEDNNTTPSTMSLIDWQMAGITSPVIDLSYFIYTCVDTEIHKNVNDLLDVYYKSLSDCLSQLGCDSAQVFPYEMLAKHWQRFSHYGLLLGTFVLKFSLAEGDDAPDFTESAESGKDFFEFYNFSLTNNKDVFHKRVKDNILHYIRNSGK